MQDRNLMHRDHIESDEFIDMTSLAVVLVYIVFNIIAFRENLFKL
jgi:hypothetical protein